MTYNKYMCHGKLFANLPVLTNSRKKHLLRNVTIYVQQSFNPFFRIIHYFKTEIILIFFLQGPFSTFHIQNDPNIEWTGMKFSSDGKMILLATNGGVIHLIDAFQGTQLHTFTVSIMCTVVNNNSTIQV